MLSKPFFLKMDAIKNKGNAIIAAMKLLPHKIDFIV